MRRSSSRGCVAFPGSVGASATMRRLCHAARGVAKSFRPKPYCARNGAHAMIEIVPLSRHVGAEVRGIDLSRPVDPGTATELYAAWLKHLVLVIRGQTLSVEDQRRFTLLFGEIQPHARARASATRTTRSSSSAM